MTPPVDELRLRELWTRAGQGHVFRFLDALDAEERARFLESLCGVDLAQVTELAALARAGSTERSQGRFEAPDVFTLAHRRNATNDVRRARARGEALLAAGAVGFLLVAGGQASRLGYDGPKGAFPVGPVTGRSLFEVFARRIHATARAFGVRPPWYVMTSVSNDAATRAFFAGHDWFGLDPADVFFFTQAMLPALDRSGRVLLAGRGELFLAPDGHGGTLMALRRSGALEHARARGVETFAYFQVDNPLARPADPLFLGLHSAAGAPMSSKVVAKRSAHEKVGVLGKVDGKLSCIEYSDLPADLREARDARGELLFGAGNIALHAFQRAFVEDLTRGGLKLPWHVAQKSMVVVDERGAPTSIEGFKFETFVFDALAFVEQSVTLEVERGEEFSPVKNKVGEDSPHTARAAQCALFAEWVRRAGRALPPPDEHGHVPVEVDPVLAEDAETFAVRAPAEPRRHARGHFWT